MIQRGAEDDEQQVPVMSFTEQFLRMVILLLLITTAIIKPAWASWDGQPSLDDINFNLENFLDINAYQFRHSEEINWQQVENGFRLSSGSLSTNLLYLNSELRLKQEITPNAIVRLRLTDEEFYEPRDFPRPLLEMEIRPTSLPLSLSLTGRPAYAKRDADIGLAVTIGDRPRNYLRLAWLSAEHFFNEKNQRDDSLFQRHPEEWSVASGWQWADRYQLQIRWQQDNPLALVLDDQIAVFTYENKDYRLTFDYRTATDQHLGISYRGFETTQALKDNLSPRSQNLSYFSLDGYWFRAIGDQDEWTVGLRYDDFTNEERLALDIASSFDFSYTTVQVYSTYNHPYSSSQAWELGLYLGDAKKEQNNLDSSLPDTSEDRIEAKLRTGWELFSIDHAKALSVALTFNLDDINRDYFDGGAVRLRMAF